MEKTTNIYVVRDFNCGKPELFNWLIDPALISLWFGPKELKTGKIEVSAEEGGAFKIEMIRPDQSHFFITGEYLEIRKFEAIQFSFCYRGLNSNPPDSKILITLESIDSKKTRLSLIQKFAHPPTDMSNRAKAWEYMFLKLSQEINSEQIS